MARNLQWTLSLAIFFLAYTEAKVSCAEDFNVKWVQCFCTEVGIKYVPKDLMADLEFLKVTDCDLTELRNDSFSPYPALTKLDLSFNNISKIDSGAFLNIRRLTKLVLSFNPYLPRLDSEPFNNLFLSEFLANYNDIKTFPKGLFSRISLTDNKIDHVILACEDDNFVYNSVVLQNNNIRRMTKNAFVCKCNVDTMDLTKNRIEEIDPALIASLKIVRLQIGEIFLPLQQLLNLFEGMKLSKITHLQLPSIGLERIYSGLFSHLYGKRLEHFDLSYNNLQNLPDQAFVNLSLVTRLTLDRNNIQVFNPQQFNGIRALRILSLKHNKISLINQYRNNWNLNTAELYLGGNPIRSIDKFSLKNMTSLRLLDLSDNLELQSIGNESFIDCLGLESLDLSGTEILNMSIYGSIERVSLKSLILRNAYVSDKFVQPGQLGGRLTSLEKLNLEGTSLNVLLLWDHVQNISSFQDLYKLNELFLSHNHFPTIQIPLFRNLSELAYLRLSFCKILHISKNVFDDLRRLKRLDLNSNLLQVLEPKLLHRLQALEEFFVADNELTSFDENFFEDNMNLKNLNLFNNKLTTLNFLKLLLPSLREIDLGDNPLVCNCEAKWLSTWLLHGSVKLLEGIGTVCAASSGTLPPFREKQLITFDPSKDCGPNIVMYSSVALAGVASLLLAALIYYNRWFIGNRLFLLKLYLKGYEEILDDEERKNFVYDLNFIFHHTDEGWVTDRLRPSLEERLPEYDRLSCGDEDLMLGMYYLDAVNYAVENSFKIIVVISRTAVQDHWFMLKFRTALDHVNDIATEKIALIFLEDIPRDELPFLLRLFLADKRPYLSWTDDDRGQVYFWDELVKNLTVNIKCNHVIPP